MGQNISLYEGASDLLYLIALRILLDTVLLI